MNMLIDALPTEVKIEDKYYKINSDYRTSILFEIMLQDEEVSEVDKIYNALNLYYGDNIPANIQEAINKIIWFYSCGKGPKKHTGKNIKLYDYEVDAGLIYAAFKQQYNIDLTETDLHYWKFRELFASLTDITQFVKVMGYRSINLNSIKDTEERKRYKELKEFYALPKKVSKAEEERIKTINKLLAEGKDISEFL